MASPCTPRCVTPHDVPGLRGWRHVDPRRWVQGGDCPRVVEERDGAYVAILGGARMKASRVAERSHATAEDAMRAAGVRRG